MGAAVALCCYLFDTFVFSCLMGNEFIYAFLFPFLFMVGSENYPGISQLLTNRQFLLLYFGFINSPWGGNLLLSLLFNVCSKKSLKL